MKASVSNSSRSSDEWRRPRLHAREIPSKGLNYPLSAAEVVYLTKVLRLKHSAEVYLFDGHGNEFSSKLQRDGRDWWCEVSDKVSFANADPVIQVHVGQGSGSRNRIDWAIEKMTELGAASITPLSSFGSARTDAKPAAERWRRLASSAAAQSGRCIVPVIGEPSSLADWNQSLPADCTKYLLSLQPGTKLLSETDSCRTAAVLIGRMSGLDDAEEQTCMQLGFMPVSLGTRVLRVETAGLAVLSILLAKAGEM